MMKEKLAKLVDLKSIITFMVIVAMIVFTYLGIIGPELFVTTTGAVATYYFTRKRDAEKVEIQEEPTNVIGFQQEEKEV